MNWSKIKSIMIYFLIAMNTFMIAFIALTSIRESSIPDEVITASVEVLKRDGFKCDASVIPDTYYNLPDLGAQFYSAGELSDIFFGKQLAFKTADNCLVASEGSSTLTVFDYHFTYESGFSPFVNQSPKKIKRALEKSGINMRGAVYDEKENCFYLMYNNTNLFNMYIKAQLDSDGELCTVNAQWPKTLAPKEKNNISFVESITNVKNAFPDGGKIHNIELGYSLRSGGNENYVFVPSWRLLVDDELKILE